VKAVILAGGMGTRISEETSLRPKPMIEVGGKPILWHILKIYAAHGINDFVICLGFTHARWHASEASRRSESSAARLASFLRSCYWYSSTN